MGSRMPYRWRTRLRRHLPWFVINLGIAAKGRNCEAAGGEHEWYNRDGVRSACYHCEVVRDGRLWTRKEREPPSLPGVADVIAQLGEWPSFHDAEIVRAYIERDGRSMVTIKLTAPVYKQKRVTFTFERIADLSLGGEEINVQNVIFDLHVEQDGKFTSVEFAPCYGLSGSIKAESVTVSVD